MSKKGFRVSEKGFEFRRKIYKISHGGVSKGVGSRKIRRKAPILKQSEEHPSEPHRQRTFTGPEMYIRVELNQCLHCLEIQDLHRRALEG